MDNTSNIYIGDRMEKKQILAIAVVAVIVVAALGAFMVMSGDKDNTPESMVDAAGNEIVIPDEVKSITAASPSIADIVCYMGYGSKIVCVSKYCTNSQIPSGVKLCGSYTSPDTDVISTVNATVSFIDGSNAKAQEAYKTLRGSGMNVVMMYGTDDSSDGVYKNVQILGFITGNYSKADAVVNDLKDVVSGLADKTSSAKTTNVLITTGFGNLSIGSDGKFTNLSSLDGSGVYAAGDTSLINDLANDVCAVENDVKGGWALMDTDAVSTSTSNVDVMLILWTNRDSMPTEDSKDQLIAQLKTTAWANCGAVKNGNIFFIGGDVGSDLSRATPYTIENGLPILSLLINPDAFSATSGGSPLTWDDLPCSIDNSNTSKLVDYTENKSK